MATQADLVLREISPKEASRMLKKSASIVLASLRGSTYRSVRLASSLAAALLDGLFENPAWCAPLLHVRDKKRTLSQDSHTRHTRLAERGDMWSQGMRVSSVSRVRIFFEILLTSRAKAANRGSSKVPNRDLAPYRGVYVGPRLPILPKLAHA